jgi:Cdc6-like AAA superfamily ATPase
MLKIDKHFDEYVSDVERENYHLELKKIYDKFPDQIEDFKNVLYYGKSGVGKYSQMLYSIKKYSPSSLKYEKKMCITLQDKKKSNYFIKISDIHYEVDMSLLSCNAKTLWNTIYYQICDAVKAKNGTKHGIIVCKNFQEIHNELLDSFYSYMNNNKYLKFIILTESLSFIPENIVNSCRIINIKLPTIKNIPDTGSLQSFIKRSITKSPISHQIINLKDTRCHFKELIEPHSNICNKIIKMITTDDVEFLKFREYIYNLFILQYDVCESVWYIIRYLITYGFIYGDDVFDILKKQYEFYYYYNNNYRPIYHLEKYFLYLKEKIQHINK